MADKLKRRLLTPTMKRARLMRQYIWQLQNRKFDSDDRIGRLENLKEIAATELLVAELHRRVFVGRRCAAFGFELDEFDVDPDQLPEVL